MRKACSKCFRWLGVLILVIIRGKAASLNTATLVFGSAFPSSFAAPGSCIHITAQAEPLYDITSILEAQPNTQWSASTLACPSLPPFPESSLDGALRYTLLIEDLHPSNSSSQHLAIKIQATQQVFASPNMELRWHRTVILDFSAGSSSSSAGNLDVDLQLAKLYSTRQSTKQPPSKPLEDSPFTITTEKACVTLLEEEDLASNSKFLSSSALVAVLCLVAGIATGRAFSAKLSSHTIQKKKKHTCEVACSPFIMEKVKAGGGKAKKHKWTRDPEGRLQREDKINRAGAGFLVLEGDGGAVIAEDDHIDIEE